MDAWTARILSIGALLVSGAVWLFPAADAYADAFGSEFGLLDSDGLLLGALGFATLAALAGAGFAFLSWKRAPSLKWLSLILICLNLLLPPLGFANMVHTGYATSAMLEQR